MFVVFPVVVVPSVVVFVVFPVVVFLGNDNFVAYVPAVRDEWINQ